ncbi:MAG: hypothetical protein VYD87_05880 [Pseudomonadota bacterium]|nr:hypothetical protein [Pseudomonadota bacterium]
MSRPGRRLRALVADEAGSATLDFALAAGPLFGMFLFGVTVAMGHYAMLAGADAARRAARLAATLPIAHCAALRDAEGGRRHLAADAAAPPPADAAGRACLAEPSPCAPLTGAWICPLGDAAAPDPACDAALIARIAAEAQAPGLRLAALSVAYADSGAGELGGPVAPRITVTLRPAPPDLPRLLLPGFEALPAVSASAIGESLGGGAEEGPRC